MAVDILAIARRFTDEHDCGVCFAFTEDGLRRVFVEIATMTMRSSAAKTSQRELFREIFFG
jgi:hypothetical protein